MDKHNWDRVETILDDVLTLPKEERKSFIEETCGDDKALKAEVTQLLKSILNSEGWLEDAADYKEELYHEISEDLQELSSTRSLIGVEIGSYRIKEKLGEGGMGLVYRAERADGEFEHQVALKIIRNENASQENIRRFKQERTILAGLNHPGIAKLFDGGITSDGYPYFVMEYVDGIRIDEYCRKHECTVKQRIELFKQMLEAVRHAHENLVIHRDLKPGNILVNSAGKVKILDFGISKLVQKNQSTDTQLTRTNARLLTPKYAAPEQILQSSITTATDIYALGVVFYQLLTESHPFDLDNLSQFEMEQTILQDEAPKPSTCVCSKKVQQQLKGDLDAIALKAIRKEPDKRYRVANEFLDELNKYEQGLPVAAHEDSLKYRTQKLFARHKQVFVTAAVILLLIVGFTGFYTWRITQERNKSRLEARKATEVKNFMLSIFDSSNPDMDTFAGGDITAKELLKSGIKKVENEVGDQPKIYVDLMSSIGDALLNFDEFEASDNAMKKALKKSIETFGPNSYETSEIYFTLSNLRNSERKFVEAEDYILKSIEIKEQLFGKNAEELIHAYGAYASVLYLRSKYRESIALFDRIDSVYTPKTKRDSLYQYIDVINRASAEAVLGQYEDAEAHLKEALSFYNRYYDGLHYNIALTKLKLGNTYYKTSEHQKAENFLKESLSEFKQLIGEKNDMVAQIYYTLAQNSRVMGNMEQAEYYAQLDLEVSKKLYGEDDIRLSSSLNMLGLVQKAIGNLDEAEQNLKKALAFRKQQVGADNPDLAVPLYNLAHLLHAKGNYDQSLTMFNQVVDIDKKSLGPDSPDMAIDLNKVAMVLRDMGRFAESDSVFREAGKIFEKQFPENHQRVAEHLVDYGKLRFNEGKPVDGAKKMARAYHIYLDKFGKNHTKVKEIEALLDRYNVSSQHL